VKKITITMLTIVILAFFSVDAMAQTENTDAGAKILVGMTITEGTSMHFGTMTVPSTIAEVDLAVGGDVSIASGTLTLLAQAPTSKAADYYISGDNDATYVITLPTNGTVSITDGSNPMQVIDFISSVGTTSTLDFSGMDYFSVGATLQLANAQPAGTYTGTFDVSVAYN